MIYHHYSTVLYRLDKKAEEINTMASANETTPLIRINCCNGCYIVLEDTTVCTFCGCCYGCCHCLSKRKGEWGQVLSTVQEGVVRERKMKKKNKKRTTKRYTAPGQDQVYSLQVDEYNPFPVSHDELVVTEQPRSVSQVSRRSRRTSPVVTQPISASTSLFGHWDQDDDVIVPVPLPRRSVTSPSYSNWPRRHNDGSCSDMMGFSCPSTSSVLQVPRDVRTDSPFSSTSVEVVNERFNRLMLNNEE